MKLRSGESGAANAIPPDSASLHPGYSTHANETAGSHRRFRFVHCIHGQFSLS
jgi:hypothetical protein